MPSLLRFQHDATASRSSMTLPAVLLVASILAYSGTSTKHSLLTSAVAWLSICTYCTLRIGARSLLDAAPSQRLAWGAGALLCVAQVCERAVDGKGIWWAKALLPALMYTFVRGGIFEESTQQPESPASPTKPTVATAAYASRTTITILTASGLVAVYAHTGSITVIALGLSYAVLQVLAYHLVERAQGAARHHIPNGSSVIYSANGLLAQPIKPSMTGEEQWISILRDVAAAAAVTTGLAALSLESLRFGGLAYYGLIGQAMGDHWVYDQGILSIVYALGIVLVHILMFGALILMIQRQGSLLAAFVPLYAAIASQLLLTFSLSRLWFAALSISAAFSFLDEQGALPSATRTRMRFGRLLSLTALISFLVLTVYYLQQPLRTAVSDTPADPLPTTPIAEQPAEPLKPLEYVDTRTHPIQKLAQNAHGAWESKLQIQSQTLEAAVTEYKRRYGMPPPPHFDKWYDFAKKKGVQLIDEYDTIYHALLPFWALSPVTIRGRAREALGYGVDNQLMGLLVRDGKATHVEGGGEWQQQATVGMMEQFIEYLPDMDLAFNLHDEPRVVVPHDTLSRLIDVALNKNIPALKAQQTLKNAFSQKPKDLTTGKRLAEVKTTRFNVYAHQPTWIPSRLSCAPDTPARALEQSLAIDNMTAYALGELGFVYNQTAFSDICNSPSLGHSHGFFDRPNAFNIVHDLFPIFSQSKMSSFQDILYPSPWYWYGKVGYNDLQDHNWPSKANKLWWRGSTTGGFSRSGGWKRQHRQQLVGKINALDTAKILQQSNSAATDKNPDRHEWIVQDVPREEFKSVMDVHFSHVGQCDPGDCDAQREFFDIVEPAEQHEAWKFKYLLDMDGNAFSGRFYAFLKSHSLTFKMAVFREWHEEWIVPWVHYIPLSLKGEEVLEAVRYFDAEEEGKDLGQRMAEEGREWAGKALRNEDFEVWFFRLLLEYGRVVDDERERIGYSGA